MTAPDQKCLDWNLFLKDNQKQKFVPAKSFTTIEASDKERFLEEIRKNDVLIILGETGGGKIITQLPQFLCNEDFCSGGRQIGITQGQPVTALTVAKCLAEECEVELGQEVGYSCRFDDVTSAATRIKYMTDGVLLREALLDPLLSRYSVVIVNEAHMRTVHTDVLLELLKGVQKARLLEAREVTLEEESNVPCQGSKLLKLIIISASLDASGLPEYFGGARAVHIQGSQYPVDILYTPYPPQDCTDSLLTTIFQIHKDEGPGDILTFLTGKDEMDSLEYLIQERVHELPENRRNLSVFSVFSSLPLENQMLVFKRAPAGFRKVILAATSVTIPGVKYVIDPGLVKVRFYIHSKQLDSLITTTISKVDALQRSGHTGREGPGKCFRLYPEREFAKFEDSTTPEIKRCNLSNVILQLKAFGVGDILEFDFMKKLSRNAVVNALEELFLLGALTDKYKLSNPVGSQMARLPLSPVYSKALISASQFNCLEEMLICVAMLSAEFTLFAPPYKLQEASDAWVSFNSLDGDHLTLVNIYRASAECLEKSRLAGNNEKKAEKAFNKWCGDNFINSRSLKHARDIHSQIRGHVEQMGLQISSCGEDMLQFRRCLAASFFLNVAQRQEDGSYRTTVGSETVRIVGSSVLHGTKPDCVVFNELVRSDHRYMHDITSIDPLWLPELVPDFYALPD